MKTECEKCESENLSDCCGASIVMGDICSECKEHCGTMCDDCMEDNIPDVDTFSDADPGL